MVRLFRWDHYAWLDYWIYESTQWMHILLLLKMSGIYILNKGVAVTGVQVWRL